MSSPTVLTDLSTIDDLTNAIKIGKDKLCVVMFTAAWCGPCKKIKSEIISSLTSKYEKVAHFFFVDIDDNRELADEFDIKSVPQFRLMRNGKSGVSIKKSFTGGKDLVKHIEENI